MRNVSFVEAIKLGFQNYVNFKGRSQRAEYWWWILFVTVAGIALVAVDIAIFGADDSDPTPLSNVFSLATFVPGLSVGVRRLHDIGKSGWWILIGLIPLIGIIVLIVWFVRDSDRGTNRFGPSPKYGSEMTVFD